MITRGRLIRFAVLVVSGFCLAACRSSGSADPPRPPATPTPVTATPTSPTATPTASTISDDEAWARVPKDARAHTFAGTQAFAEFYMAQVNDAWQKPDPDAIRPYATDGCKTCRNLVSTAEAMAERGERYASRPFAVRAAAWQPGSAANAAVVDVLVDQVATKIIDRMGHTVQSIPADKGESSFDVRWRGGHWRVNEMRLVVVK